MRCQSVRIQRANSENLCGGCHARSSLSTGLPERRSDPKPDESQILPVSFGSDIRERVLGNMTRMSETGIRTRIPDSMRAVAQLYSIFRPANSTTFFHLSVSALIMSPKASGDWI